ncbi:unnamed protein product [Didymodactylos carnosus]|uniref:Uncharacterized protein n=1 Tax=Didymodactylos carnosus TaxID=1234261 RepID=A0A814KVF3_9BILA|nr:unnamed protein product [Didymodactylos carnosus]CAF1057421.1 unnamed protein product [Didymodactylos carnosus]CAF3654945.1 unnamed protein product [Didymodactylos carnosus]CAF3826229.1 unnamed protein product [Didymodactylos carnosus]
MAPVSQLSCLWFGMNERTRATAVALFGASLGVTVGFLITPYIVSEPDNIPYLLYLHVGLSFFAVILTLLYFPSIPPSPPSAAAELLIYHPLSEEQGGHVKLYLRNLWQCLSSPSCLLLSLAAGITTGALGAWAGLLATILGPMNYSEAQAGWFGFGNSLASMFGSLVMGSIADRQYFQRRLKFLILASLICCFLSITWFQLGVRTLFYDKPLVPLSISTIALSISFTGLFAGAASPLMYECLAEIMHPLPESLSASTLAQWNNVMALILLSIAPKRYKLMNLLVLLLTGVAIIMISFVKVTYKRKDEDERKKHDRKELNDDSQKNPYKQGFISQNFRNSQI